MKNITFLLMLLEALTIITPLKIIPLKNNVLPILLGKAYITKRHIQLIYHIDLGQIEDLIIKYQKEIDNFKSKQLGFSQTAHYKYLQNSNSINVKTLEELLNGKIREKRGLINIGGKISKILFGTLDSDDEELYKNYFDSIKKNEEILMRNQKHIATIVNDLKNKYIDKFRQLTNNFKLLQIIPLLEDVEQMHLMTFEIKDIKNILDEIQTAVSFARLHILHESILPYTKFAEIVKNDTIIPLHHLKDYFQLCHTKVIFKDKILLFLISIPTVYEENFNLYRFYYIPQRNLTLPFTNPFMLTRDEELKWSTKQCHQVEEDYLCDQDSLDSPPECMKSILKTHVENCPRKEFSATPNLKTLEDGSILSINNLEIQEKCPQQTKYHHFTPPMAIIQSKCIVSNYQKEIYPIQTLNEEKYIILPKVSVSTLNNRSKEEEEEPEDEETPDILLEEIEQWKWNSPLSTFMFILILTIIFIIIYVIYRFFQLKATPQRGDTFIQRGEELCSRTPY